MNCVQASVAVGENVRQGQYQIIRPRSGRGPGFGVAGAA
jgi:hypothetical protein